MPHKDIPIITSVVVQYSILHLKNEQGMAKHTYWNCGCCHCGRATVESCNILQCNLDRVVGIGVETSQYG